VNTSDSLGNTALHHSAMRDQRAMTVALLQCGADPTRMNQNGEVLCQLDCSNEDILQLPLIAIFNHQIVFLRRRIILEGYTENFLKAANFGSTANS